jgi:protein-arginine kinase activator protein McsA
MLANATKDERYNDANNIQIELDKRKVLNKYANFNNEELKTKLETAIKDENYAEAEIIQKEIDKRTKLNKTEKNDSNKQGNQPAKKTLKELESDLKNAMDVEDYKKADEIQKEINNLKK